MAIRTMSSREFTRDVAAAKHAAEQGPVFITDRGEPSHVLLSVAEYERLASAKQRSLLDAMEALPRSDGLVLELPARRTVAGHTSPAGAGVA